MKSPNEETSQFEYHQKIYNELNINTVSCGMCPTVFFHNKGEEVITCPNCGFESDISDFPDLYYE